MMDEKLKQEREHEDHFKNLNDLNRLLSELDDRGLVLAVASFAEEALGELLKAFMVPSEATNLLLDGFNAPLGTFSSRIKASYSMGLIGKNQYSNLETLRKIRNEFAHTWKNVNFQEPRIYSLVDSMKFHYLSRRFPETPSEKIRSSLGGVLLELIVVTELIKKQNKRAEFLARGVIAGFSGEDFNDHVESAKDELTKLNEKLENSTGKEHEFYRGLLDEFSTRFNFVLRPSASEIQASDYNQVRLYLSATLEKYPNI